MSGPIESREALRRLALAGQILLASAGMAAAQQGSCVISGQTMVCPNGVTINGVGQSVFFGKKALNEGTGDYRTPDGREVFELGNKGITIGGRGEAERRLEPPR